MVGNTEIRTDDSFISYLDGVLYRLESCLALLGGIAILGLIFLAVVSVAGRNFFLLPLPGYVDWVEQSMPLIAFLAISYVQRNGFHIRMDMLIMRLNGRFLYAVELFTTLVVLFLVGFLLWGSFSHFLRSFDLSSPLWSRDSSMDIAIPLWPAKLMIPFAFGVLFVRLLLQTWGFAQAFIKNDAYPAAVPVPKNVAEEAQSQIEIAP